MGFIRKKNRLADKKLYEGNNAYFVTICVQDRFCAMDFVNNGDTVLYGDTVVASTKHYDTVVASTVQKSLLNLLEMYDDIVLDYWVIMPNHIHFILFFGNKPISKISGKIASLGDIVRSFKLHSQKTIVEATTVLPLSDFNYHKFWQKSFYDHIIRNEQDLARTREYIQNNPKNWQEDILNKDNKDKYDLWVKRNEKM